MLDSRDRTNTLRLQEFVPFRLNRLATAVSFKLSEIYRERFDLEIPEWRVLVTLGQYRECTATRIASSTRMHKTRVSRAIASLEERDLVSRGSNAKDGREMCLGLTKAGQRTYAALAPLALERELELLSCLSGSQRRCFLEALALLEKSLDVIGEE